MTPQKQRGRVYTPTLSARVEQALAFGRSLDWICEHLEVEPSAVDDAMRRMDQACGITEDDDEDDEPEPSLAELCAGRPLESFYGPADPAVIRELIDAMFPPRGQAKVEQIRYLAETGSSDEEIAAVLSSTAGAVRGMRERHGIAAALRGWSAA